MTRVNLLIVITLLSIFVWYIRKSKLSTDETSKNLDDSIDLDLLLNGLNVRGGYVSEISYNRELQFRSFALLTRILGFLASNDDKSSPSLTPSPFQDVDPKDLA